MKTISISRGLLVILLLLPVCLIYTQSIDNQYWNQFRGAERNGKSVEKVELSEDILAKGPQLLWKRSLGNAFSEVLVYGDRAYTMYGEKKDSLTGTEYVICLDVENGETLWEAAVDSMFFDQFGDGPRSTPVIDEDKVYLLSSYGKLKTYDKKNGELLWQVDLVRKFNNAVPRWGFSSSPLLSGDILIVETGANESRAFSAFDKNSGELLWSNGNGTASYCSPLLVEVNGVNQILFANQQTLYSLNMTGDTLWTFQMPTVSPTAMPVFFDENKIFISSLSGKGFCVVEIGENGAREVFKGRAMKNDFSSSIYHDAHFYGFNVAALQCISALDGGKKWTKRGLGKGSLIKVDNYLFVLSDKGKMLIIDADAESYNEILSFQALQGKSWTAPSFSGSKIFVRNLQEIACYTLSI